MESLHVGDVRRNDSNRPAGAAMQKPTLATTLIMLLAAAAFIAVSLEAFIG